MLGSKWGVREVISRYETLVYFCITKHLNNPNMLQIGALRSCKIRHS